MVDPIPAFLDQLRAYEKECRTQGHLTVVDDTNENYDEVKKDSKGDMSCRDNGAGKRKTENNSGGDEKKRRVVGPAIGPSMAPARGPVTASIGPARGPPQKEFGGK